MDSFRIAKVLTDADIRLLLSRAARSRSVPDELAGAPPRRDVWSRAIQIRRPFDLSLLQGGRVTAGVVLAYSCDSDQEGDDVAAIYAYEDAEGTIHRPHYAESYERLGAACSSEPTLGFHLDHGAALTIVCEGATHVVYESLEVEPYVEPARRVSFPLTVSRAQLEELLADGADPLVVDARPPHRRAADPIPGTTPLPAEGLDPLPERWVVVVGENRRGAEERVEQMRLREVRRRKGPYERISALLGGARDARLALGTASEADTKGWILILNDGSSVYVELCDDPATRHREIQRGSFAYLDQVAVLPGTLEHELRFQRQFADYRAPSGSVRFAKRGALAEFVQDLANGRASLDDLDPLLKPPRELPPVPPPPPPLPAP